LCASFQGLCLALVLPPLAARLHYYSPLTRENGHPVELELGSVSKELETINADKLDLLTSKVKINKGVCTSDMLLGVSI
jgi:hypothetical protein